MAPIINFFDLPVIKELSGVTKPTIWKSTASANSTEETASSNTEESIQYKPKNKQHLAIRRPAQYDPDPYAWDKHEEYTKELCYEQQLSDYEKNQRLLEICEKQEERIRKLRKHSDKGWDFVRVCVKDRADIKVKQKELEEWDKLAWASWEEWNKIVPKKENELIQNSRALEQRERELNEFEAELDDREKEFGERQHTFFRDELMRIYIQARQDIQEDFNGWVEDTEMWEEEMFGRVRRGNAQEC